MRVRFILLLSASLLQGCEGALYLGAHAAMFLGALTNIKPDRSMSFRLEIAVDTDRTVVFEGKKQCINEAMLHGSAYRTVDDKVEATSHGTNWILQGIDCERMSRRDLEARYTLYEETGETTARVRYLINDPTQIVFAQYHWDSYLGFGGKLPKQHQNVRFATGPFAFQKFTLDIVPEKFADLTEATQIHFNFEHGCKDTEGKYIRSKKMEYSSFKAIFDTSKPLSVENGVLSYSDYDRTWTVGSEVDDTQPLTAVSTKGWQYANNFVWPSCIRVSTSDGSSMFGSRSDWIFFPKSKTLVRVSLLTHKQFFEYAGGKNARALWVY